MKTIYVQMEDKEFEAIRKIKKDKSKGKWKSWRKFIISGANALVRK